MCCNRGTLYSSIQSEKHGGKNETTRVHPRVMKMFYIEKKNGADLSAAENDIKNV